MKRKTAKPYLLAIFMLLAGVNAFAWEFESGGLYYNILSEGEGTVEVTYKILSFDNKHYVSGDIDIPQRVTYNDKTYTVTSIGEYAFYECHGLSSVTIPNTVSLIGEYAFYYCDGLSSAPIPESVTSIGDYAFAYCDSLSSVAIPDSVTALGRGVFNCCLGLTSVTVPKSVTSIGIGAFGRCEKLEKINVSPENLHYSSLDGVLYNKGASVLICCPGAKNSVSIPNSVTSIDNVAFEYCSNLSAITIPNSVTSIGYNAFESCTGLSSVTIPNSVISIGSSAFTYCTGLTSVTISNSVTSIGYSAFYACNNIKSFYLQWKDPVKCEMTFPYSMLKNTVIYIPRGTLAAYKKVDPWGTFRNIKEIDYSGIGNPMVDNNATPHVSVVNGILIVDGLGDDEIVYVFDMKGQLILRTNSHVIDSLPQGIYIVKVANRAKKISI